MKNKELKEALIGDKTYQEYKKRFRRWDKFSEFGVSCSEYYEVKDGLDPEEWKALEQLRISEKRRKRNCRDRIIRMVNKGDVWFLTITFRDDVLAVTNAKTRRVYVARWLKMHFRDYVANVDYGDENGREHYHAVVQGHDGCIEYDWVLRHFVIGDIEAWDYGFTDVDRVNVESTAKLTDYVMKLTAHAVKRSTDPLGNRLIYART